MHFETRCGCPWYTLGRNGVCCFVKECLLDLGLVPCIDSAATHLIRTLLLLMHHPTHRLALLNPKYSPQQVTFLLHQVNGLLLAFAVFHIFIVASFVN